MKVRDKEVTLNGTKGKVIIKRDDKGVPHIKADKKIDLYYGLGYMHGHDRQLQMWLVKLIASGRASEKLMPDKELIELDKFMRWLRVGADAKREVKKLSPPVKKVFDAYCRGVNDGIDSAGIPFEFRLMGYRPEPWSHEDIAAITLLIGYAGLSQGQGDMEKFILQIIQNGLDIPRIKELFPAIKEKVPKELIDIIRKIKLTQPLVPFSVPWLNLLPRITASNNWALSPGKTASGNAILCGDPHVPLLLPSICYSAVMTAGNDFMMGATIPGAPILLMGRARNLAWSVTYAPMDMTDYFIEDVKGEKYRRGNRWVPLRVREEIIRPKKKKPVVMKYYESEHGILEGEVEEDGYYLSFALSSRGEKIDKIFSNYLKVPDARNTKEGMKYFSGLSFAPCNWVMADTNGNIGYQMSGTFPRKAKGSSGLLPYTGWDSKQDWKGAISPAKHPRAYNPKEGFIVTANNDLNELGEVSVISLPMSGYRADRIKKLLKKGKSWTVDKMKEMQYDLYSLQAEAFMAIIRPLLPATKNGEILNNWDMRYDARSPGAALFERVYMELLKIVFGDNGFGLSVFEHLISKTSLFAMLHGNFDSILLKKNSKWFGGISRDDIYRKAIESGLKGKPVPYGRTEKIYITNLLLGGRLPGIFGFDYGPMERIGSRATIVQNQTFKAGRMTTGFFPVYRLIADMGENVIHTNIAGGPSDRRFSKYYFMGIKEWLSGIYTVLKP